LIIFTTFWNCKRKMIQLTWLEFGWDEGISTSEAVERATFLI
jgi:hypothetical protein